MPNLHFSDELYVPISSRKLDLSVVGFALCVCVVQDVFGGHAFLCAIVLALQLSQSYPSAVLCPGSAAV